MAAPLVDITVTVESLVHLKEVLDGVLLGPSGNVTVNPKLRALVDAVYETLAGGTVTVNVTQSGDAGKVKALHDKEVDSLKSSNAFNKNNPNPITIDI